jgi:hypothetical protein
MSNAVKRAEGAGLAPRTGEIEARRTFAVPMRTIVIGLAAFLTLVDLFATQAILPLLRQAYGVTPAAMALAVNASTIGMAVASLVVAFFSQKIDRRWGIILSLALLAIPTLCLAFAPNLAVFATLRILFHDSPSGQGRGPVGDETRNVERSGSCWLRPDAHAGTEAWSCDRRDGLGRNRNLLRAGGGDGIRRTCCDGRSSRRERTVFGLLLLRRTRRYRGARLDL